MQIAAIVDPAIRDFYSIHSNAQKFLTLRRNQDVPLRLISWFCSIYCRDVPVVYMLGDTRREIFNVYHSYRAHLKSYKKKEFDPINRGYPIFADYQSPTFQEGMPIHITTSLCQLIFFRWYISNMVYVYIARHRDEIDKARHQYESSSSNNSSSNSSITMVIPIEIYLKIKQPGSSITSSENIPEIYDESQNT